MGSHQRQLSLKKIALRNQHIQVICQATLVTKIGKTQRRPQRVDLLQLCRALFTNRADCDQRILHLLERDQHRLLILSHGLSRLRLGSFLLETEDLSIQQWSGEAWPRDTERGFIGH